MPPPSDISAARPGIAPRRPAPGGGTGVAARTRARSGSPAGVPLLIWLFLITVVLVPIELGFYLGPLFFTWSKAFLMVMAIPVVVRAVSELRWTAADGLFMAHTLWSTLCTLLNRGAAGAEMAGTYAIELAVVYLMVRLQLQSLAQIRATVRLLFWLVAICGAVAIPEALLERRFVHEFASSLTGITYFFSDEERFGLLRAASFFEHPILHGLFCAVLFSMVWYTHAGFGRLVRAAVITTATFFGMSSAPLLVIFTQMGLIWMERVTRALPNRLMVITLSVVGLVLFLNVTTGRGALGFLTILTFDPSTAFYRSLIWTHGIDDVMRSPIIGMIPENWTRLPWMVLSIDNQWLLMSMRSGLPGTFFFMAALYAIWRALSRVPLAERPPLFHQLRLGWGIMIVAFLLGGATVAYFGRMQPLGAFYIGLGAALALTRERVADPAAETPPARGAAPAARTPRTIL